VRRKEREKRLGSHTMRGVREEGGGPVGVRV